MVHSTLCPYRGIYVICRGTAGRAHPNTGCNLQNFLPKTGNCKPKTIFR